MRHCKVLIADCCPELGERDGCPTPQALRWRMTGRTTTSLVLAVTAARQQRRAGQW